MTCNASVSWEIQDHVKLRSIISSATLNQLLDSEDVYKQECHDQKPPKRYVSLRPFQHPELTNFVSCSRSAEACELRLACTGGVALHSASLAATAKAAEAYSCRGEHVSTVAGVPLGAPATNWYRFHYTSPEPSCELKFKFLAAAAVGSLRLASIHLTLVRPRDEPAAPLEASEATATPAVEEKNDESQVQAQPPQPPQQAQPQLDDEPAPVENLRPWLESRLDGIERRLNERLDQIEARLTKLLDSLGSRSRRDGNASQSEWTS